MRAEQEKKRGAEISLKRVGGGGEGRMCENNNHFILASHTRSGDLITAASKGVYPP
jgi:hypothetical protein